jgi:hypothetical protein
MQIACKRFSCQKAVEVCYWACKYRRDCKDWHGALDGAPGTDAVTERLSAAAKKSGRVFDSKTMILTSAGKKKGKKSQAAVVSKSSSVRFTPATRSEAEAEEQTEPVSPNHKINKKAKTKMTEDNFDASMAMESRSFAESAADAPTKSAAGKAKPKPVAKPKVINPGGPVYLLLYANGKYKELRESDLNSEAAVVLKDPSLRLIKGQALVPQISFKPVDE